MILEEYWQRLWSVVSTRGRRGRRRGCRGSGRRGGRGRGGRLPRVPGTGGRVLTELRRHGQERRELARLGSLTVLPGGGGQAHALTVVGLHEEGDSVNKAVRKCIPCDDFDIFGLKHLSKHTCSAAACCWLLKLLASC